MVKTLLGHLGAYKRSAIVTPIFTAIEVIFDMLIPFIMSMLIDEGVQSGDLEKIIKYGILMLISAMLALAVGVASARAGAKASTGLAKNLRWGMFSNIQTFSFSNIDKFSTASLVTRMTTDVTNIQLAFQMSMRMVSRSPLTLIIAMAMTFIINARLALIYLVAVLLLAMVLGILVLKSVKVFKLAFPKYDDLNESIQENVIGIRVVKSFVREDYETEKLKKASGNIYRLFTKAERLLAISNPVMMLTVYSCIILVSWIGANYIVSDMLTTGELMSLLTYCFNILISMMMMSMITVMITMSEASAERICEVLNEKSDLHNPENPVYEVKNGDVEFKHVMFSYHKTSEKPVLNDINISIKSGETVGIMGGTGSGKTSFINMISRLYDVDSGSVEIGGLDVREYDLEELRNQVAVVLQKNELFSGTILENLRWGDENATEEECREACVIACADDFISKMPKGYETHIEQGGTNVSGGQKQRLCIARALLKKPKILILDDSTSAVDTATESHIREALKAKLPDMTKIIISQRISSIQHADKILVMDDGAISAVGTHEELLEKSEIYAEVFESQQGGSRDFDEVGGED